MVKLHMCLIYRNSCNFSVWRSQLSAPSDTTVYMTVYMTLFPTHQAGRQYNVSPRAVPPQGVQHLFSLLAGAAAEMPAVVSVLCSPYTLPPFPPLPDAQSIMSVPNPLLCILMRQYQIRESRPCLE